MERNFRIRLGEADIIAEKNDVLLFVEVKTRAGKSYGLGEDALTPKNCNPCCNAWMPIWQSLAIRLRIGRLT
jgi:Holliday junction resolvase-like predicted endonuclease